VVAVIVPVIHFVVVVIFVCIAFTSDILCHTSILSRVSPVSHSYDI
jgi:hypothetical protein